MRIDFTPEPLTVFEQSIAENNDYYVSEMEARSEIFSQPTNCAPNVFEEHCKHILINWGGMNRRHYNMLEGNSDWLDIAQNISSGALTREEAYRAFMGLRMQGRLKGMGPAYFTKLIYFLMPENDDNPRGYIMDQWVGCSINILTGSDIVIMNRSYSVKRGDGGILRASIFTVSDINTEQNYDYYCRALETLSGIIGESPDKTECFLMSKGGRIPFTWRQYVRENRLPPSGPIL